MTTLNLKKALYPMTLSASGWRGVFAKDGDAESPSPEISDEHKAFSALAAAVFSDYLKDFGIVEPGVIVGMDSRPSGPAIAEMVIKTLLARQCRVLFLGVAAAPEIMAFARSFQNDVMPRANGFIFISASHNPIGHNGLKFGLLDGGVLGGAEPARLRERLDAYVENESAIREIEAGRDTVSPDAYAGVLNERDHYKTTALNTYFSFAKEIISGDGISTTVMATMLRNGTRAFPLGIVADFNGSARAASIDKKFFTSLNIGFAAINADCGKIAHRIVPEGDSLIPCRDFLEMRHRQEAMFLLGYTPDCDGDRGNLVIWDESRRNARPLEAQEVFALCCISELAHLVWAEAGNNIAVAVNDATSMRIDKIASYFGAQVFRAETGEANVVTLARDLRKKGYIVRILGEGAAGGNITHPSAVRDPISTVMALVKLLTIRSVKGRKGFFEIWCEKSGQMNKYKINFTLSDIIDSLPPWTTTSAYSPEAVLKVKADSHSKLKGCYQDIFERDWPLKKKALEEQFGIVSWVASGFNGSNERCAVKDWFTIKTGGLKITFMNKDGAQVASIWMRGSGTEPVFRVMADVEGANKELERVLLTWQTNMVLEADTKCHHKDQQE